MKLPEHQRRKKKSQAHAFGLSLGTLTFLLLAGCGAGTAPSARGGVPVAGGTASGGENVLLPDFAASPARKSSRPFSDGSPVTIHSADDQAGAALARQYALLDATSSRRRTSGSFLSDLSGGSQFRAQTAGAASSSSSTSSLDYRMNEVHNVNPFVQRPGAPSAGSVGFSSSPDPLVIQLLSQGSGSVRSPAAVSQNTGGSAPRAVTIGGGAGCGNAVGLLDLLGVSYSCGEATTLPAAFIGGRCPIRMCILRSPGGNTSYAGTINDF